MVRPLIITQGARCPVGLSGLGEQKALIDRPTPHKASSKVSLINYCPGVCEGAHKINVNLNTIENFRKTGAVGGANYGGSLLCWAGRIRKRRIFCAVNPIPAS